MAKPYTIRFGPWAPDLQDVGVEMPMQWSDTELPAADCQNVYWQDASYRCLPSLASIGPSLGTPILDCFTWYDNTQGKEVLFATTANGMFTLVDGVWAEVSTVIQEGAAGLAITIQLGTPQCLATAMSPTSGSASGAGSSYTFGSFSAVIGYGSATSYAWSFSGQTGPGTWSVASGQGTANAVPQVTGCTPGTTSTANFVCTIVLGGYAYLISSPLSYTDNALSPLLRSYTSGSGTETVPAGYNNVVIEVKGGGAGSSATGNTLSYGCGGGGGGYCRTAMAVTGGGTFNYSVGTHGSTNLNSNGTPGGASSVSSGTLSLTTMTANGGGGASASGIGGTASGGNQANATGANGIDNGAGGASGSAGVYFDTGNTYGHGGDYNGSNASAGFVTFYYTQ
jgi:hypothetical protein